ncbi:MAG TPA: DUF1573 domain-containing protein [Lacipirellulaceae bacterium]|nr:DUF1573 domain-containing protein [Lacipirellulaceae bacterium]
MFAKTKHDFGTVARGADTSYRFEAKNIYKQDVELLSVRSSCGCTTPTIEKKVLKTGEVGYVTAVFNTRTFTGVHGATLTVEVQWNDNGNWLHGETQLRVDGNIRGDIVFTPGAVHFDDVDQGTTAEQKVEVSYAGRSNWKISDVRGASDALEVELTQTQHYTGRVAYNLLVRLKGSAAAGYFNDQLVLVTNDDENPRIPIYVSGRIVPQISVSQESLFLGDVAQGQQVSKMIIVRGKKPFKIVSIQCDDEKCFQFKTDDKSSNRHLVQIIFNAKKSAGPVKETINIATDLGNKFHTGLTAYATILPSAPATTAKEASAKSAAGKSKPASNDDNAVTAGAVGKSKGEVARQ